MRDAVSGRVARYASIHGHECVNRPIGPNDNSGPGLYSLEVGATFLQDAGEKTPLSKCPPQARWPQIPRSVEGDQALLAERMTHYYGVAPGARMPRTRTPSAGSDP